MIPGIAAQSPFDGHTEANIYVNSYFHITYSWPKMLQPLDTRALQLAQPSSNPNEFLLFAAREGGKPYGVVIVAEKLNAPTPDTNGIKDGPDFLDKVARFRPEQQVVMQPRKHFTNADGLIFDELDYTERGVPSSAVATQIGKFLIIFKCNAKSTADLAEMNKSAAMLHLSK